MHKRKRQILAQCRRRHTAGNLADILAIRRSDPIPTPRDPTTNHLQPDQFAPRPFCFDALQRLAADERPFVELDDPAKACFVRVYRLRNFVAIERELGLEAQAIARAEADRLEAVVVPLFKQAIPYGCGVLVRKEELEAILARIAGTRDDRRDVPQERARRDAMEGDRRDVDVDDPRENCLGAWPLQREHCRLVGDVLDLHHEVVRVLPHPGEVLVGIGGVDDHEVAVGQVVDEDVVDDPDVRVAHQGVVGQTLFDGRNILGGYRLKKGQGIRATDVDLAHM